MNRQGEVLAHLGGERLQTDLAGIRYQYSGFRDEKMRINDDRKISVDLSSFQEEGIQIVFLVRSFDLRSQKDIPDNTFDQAWFRLVNESTSQTLDYTKISKMQVPEGYEESPAADDEEGEARNELLIVAGRIFSEYEDARSGRVYSRPKWIYEKYNQAVTTAKYPNFHQTLADLYRSANDELAEYAELCEKAKVQLEKAAEERRQAAMAAAAKKKAAMKGKKSEQLVAEPEEIERSISRNYFSQYEAEDHDLDLQLPD